MVVFTKAFCPVTLVPYWHFRYAPGQLTRAWEQLIIFTVFPTEFDCICGALVNRCHIWQIYMQLYKSIVFSVWFYNLTLILTGSEGEVYSTHLFKLFQLIRRVAGGWSTSQLYWSNKPSGTVFFQSILFNTGQLQAIITSSSDSVNNKKQHVVFPDYVSRLPFLYYMCLYSCSWITLFPVNHFKSRIISPVFDFWIA